MFETLWRSIFKALVTLIVVVLVMVVRGAQYSRASRHLGGKAAIFTCKYYENEMNRSS